MGFDSEERKKELAFDTADARNKVKEYLIDRCGIDRRAVEIVYDAEDAVKERFELQDRIAEYNQCRVLNAFQKNRISDTHFDWKGGYGYDDPGREAAEKVYADIFGTESALVRMNLVNGTHALAVTMLGILRPGDELIYATGAPYDTLEEVIGIRGRGNGSLLDYGVTYKQIELTESGEIDKPALAASITDRTKMVTIQRSTGYGWRKALTVGQIADAADFIHSVRSDIVVMVDNSYGEFVSWQDPTNVGADVMAGSLIKNPGGGIAISGGYVCGREDLIEKISYRMTCPGIGGECGLTFGQTRGVLEGIFLAPKVVCGAVKGAILCGKAYQSLGYDICPNVDDERSDIVQAIRLGSPEAVVAFCEGIQKAAPVDSFVTPIPWDMPGYEDQVVMAAGAFVQGSSIELSSDAPIRPPYNVYFQGGLTYEHSKIGVIKSIDALIKKGLLKH